MSLRDSVLSFNSLGLSISKLVAFNILISEKKIELKTDGLSNFWIDVDHFDQDTGVKISTESIALNFGDLSVAMDEMNKLNINVANATYVAPPPAPPLPVPSQPVAPAVQPGPDFSTL